MPTVTNIHSAPDRQPVALLLLPEFTMMPVTSVIETLRLANQLSRRSLYDWGVYSADGQAVSASNGIGMAVDGDFSSVPSGAMAIVCGGYNVDKHADAQVIARLQRAADGTTSVGAVCAGVHVLAKAGLLDGRKCTIHWQSMPEFCKAYPQITVTGHFYEIDGDRFTCAGGTAAVDMMLAMISAEHGAPLATAVAEEMIHPPVRTRHERQPRAVAQSIETRHPKVLAVVKEMERTLDMPLRPSALARALGFSVRQLERLFQRYVGCSPKQYHHQLRLQRARLLLLQTGMSVREVSAACGFANPSYFSRCYSLFYDRSPKNERGIPELKAA